jgi:2-isopropylmalate synthase
VEHTASSGNGPVHALDQALRRALEQFYPSLGEVSLVDYKVRVITGALSGTASLVRVLITSSDGRTQWGTVGVSANIVDASWRALVDSVEYKLMKEGTQPKAEVRGRELEVGSQESAVCV